MSLGILGLSSQVAALEGAVVGSTSKKAEL